MKTTNRYWLVFGVFQIVGFVLFALSDPHVHFVLKTVGWVLLLPGTLAALAIERSGGGRHFACHCAWRRFAG